MQRDVETVNILVIENDQAILEWMHQFFASDPDRYKAKIVNSLKASREAVRELKPDLIIASYLLPDGWGIEFLSIKEEKKRIPMILMVNPEDEQMGLNAIKSGAMDYILKTEESILDMPRVVERAMRVWRIVDEYRKNEQEIRSALNEKETILKEIHHRVKNNFQVVCSVLSLQSQYIQDEQVLDMFMETQDRVRAMALIHEKLYKADDVGHLDFKIYMENLVHGLFWSYGTDPKRIRLEVDVEDISLGINWTVPCGLIINELVSNSLKYAFPSSWKGVGTIKISLFKNNDEEVELIVEDNGIGIPKNLDLRQIDSFGLELVTILAEDQLNGKVILKRNNGTQFRILFPKTNRTMIDV